MQVHVCVYIYVCVCWFVIWIFIYLVLVFASILFKHISMHECVHACMLVNTVQYMYYFIEHAPRRRLLCRCSAFQKHLCAAPVIPKPLWTQNPKSVNYTIHSQARTLNHQILNPKLVPRTLNPFWQCGGGAIVGHLRSLLAWWFEVTTKNLALRALGGVIRN